MSIYKPLPDGQWIRVLTLQPAAPRKSFLARWRKNRRSRPLIVCSLQVVRLNEACYEAISYVWGDPTQTRQIVCDGSLIKITVGLYGALERLQPPADGEPRVLWADAICINQSDLDERSSQVSMMGATFTRASSVQIWLGPDIDGHAQPAFDLCMEIDEYYSSGSRSDVEPIRFEFPPPPASDNPFLDPTRWVHLQSLSRCSWFERLWVIQEAGVARTAYVSWGSTGINFSHLIAAFIILVRTPILIPLWTEYGRWFSNITNSWWWIWRTYDNEQSWKNERPYLRHLATLAERERSRREIFNVLIASRTKYESDLRDCIYAYLGHPAARRNGGESFVDVDYHKSVLELYLDVAEKLLDETHGLLILSVAGRRDAKAFEGPSWVPQWQTFRSHLTPIAGLPEDSI